MILARILSVLIGYAFGLIQTGYLYGKSQGIDIRKKGSGNAGTTNSLRVLGLKAGAITFAGDFLKALAAVLFVSFLFKNAYPDNLNIIEMYAGFGVVLGHNFPFYLNFKGGKGIASTVGVVTAVYPPAAAICACLFIICLVISKYVSLSSILMMIAYFILMVVFTCNGSLGISGAYAVEYIVLAACFTAMAIWRHRANIKRLISGTENKFSIGKKKN